VVHHRTPALNDVFEWLSRIGSLGLVWVAVAVVLAVLWRRPSLFVLVVAADAIADLLAGRRKRVVHERRPPLRFPEPHALIAVPHSGSFPSGHAATSFACATVLAAFAPRLAPGFVVLACAIAFSRVYVGVHYPLDIVGGAALGVLVGLLLLAAYRRRAPLL
jgi:undecaprenyl-diphosphatase